MSREAVIAELAGRLVQISLPHVVRVAVDGVDAAGKTTLANELAEAILRRGRPVVRASVDGFHNPASVRKSRGDSSPEGYYRDSFNHTALINELLRPLGPGGSRQYRCAVFDFRLDAPVHAPLQRAERNAILLLDGVFLLRPELRGYFDYSIFVRASFESTVRRAERRDVELFGSEEAVRSRYQERYVPGQRIYLDEARPEMFASTMIDNDDFGNPVLHEKAAQPASAIR